MRSADDAEQTTKPKFIANYLLYYFFKERSLRVNHLKLLLSTLWAQVQSWGAILWFRILRSNNN